MDAGQRFVQYLKKDCPIVVKLLEPAMRYYDGNCLFYRFMPNHRQNFESLSESPLLDALARATVEIRRNISITVKDLETDFEHEILIRRTPTGLEAVRNITDRKHGDSERKDWLRPGFHA